MTRRGISALIPFIVLVLGGSFVFLVSTQYAASSAALAGVRVYDLRTCINAGRTALTGTVQTIKAGVLTNGRVPGLSMGWRDMFAPAYSKRQKPITLLGLNPVLKRHFESQGVEVTDVRMGVAEWAEPNYAAAGSFDNLPFQPQGTIGLAVTCSVERASSRVTRVIVQRWVFWITMKAGASSQNMSDNIIVHFAPTPQATMVLL